MLSSIKNQLKIMLPPIPRHAFGSCCNDTSHAPNIASPNHITTSLTEHIRQRNTIIRKLHDHKTQHFKVIDLLGTFSPTSATITDKGNGLKLHTLRDQLSPQSKPYSNSAGVKGSESCAWGGFFCTAGYGKTASVNVKLHRGGGGQRHHPYQR